MGVNVLPDSDPWEFEVYEVPSCLNSNSSKLQKNSGITYTGVPFFVMSSPYRSAAISDRVHALPVAGFVAHVWVPVVDAMEYFTTRWRESCEFAGGIDA